MIKKISGFAILIVLAAQLSGCAAAWFAGGAATGALVQHQADKK